MRIAVWWNLPPGGARRALHDHIRGLAARGHEIHIVRPPVPKPGWMSPDEFASTVEEVALPSFHATGRGYIGKALNEMRRVRSTVPAMERHSALAGRVILDRNPDVLFSSTCWSMAAPSIVRHVGTLPSVVYLQEPKRSLYEAAPTLPWVQPQGSASLPHRIRRRLSLKALAHQARIERENAVAAGTLLVNSLFSRESVRRAYGIDSELAYLGIDTDRFSPDDSPRERFVLGVGAIAPSKGLDLAIRACAGAGLPLVWVGPFEDEVYGPEIRHFAQAQGLPVEWRIGVTDAELIGLYRSCLAVVATAPLEPFGYTPLEAGACDAPVVALAEGGFRETIEHEVTGLLATDLEGLIDALQRIDQKPGLGARLGANGLRNVRERWTLGRSLDRIEEALVRAVDRRSTARE